jgi:chromosome segregation ATPase
MDAQIIQGEVAAAQEAIIALDEKVDALEEEAAEPTATETAGEIAAEPVIDLAQTVGRLEAQIAQCLSELSELRSSVRAAETTATVALIASETPEPEPEPETPEVLEVEPEPEPESEAESPERQPNWLEKLLLVR